MENGWKYYSRITQMWIKFAAVQPQQGPVKTLTLWKLAAVLIPCGAAKASKWNLEEEKKDTGAAMDIVDGFGSVAPQQKHGSGRAFL